MATPTSNGVVSNVSLNGSNYIDSLLTGKKWGGSTGTSASLTYSFGSGDLLYRTNYGHGEPKNGFGVFTDTQKTAATNALTAWSEIANIQFTQVTDSNSVAGDLRFAKSSAPFTAWAYDPSVSPEAGDIWFSHDSSYDTDTKGTFGYAEGFLHEIGHALGLKHPHDTDGSGVVADASIDTTAYSVMSYKSYVGQPVYASVGQSFYPTTPMLNDIAAIQYLYGANMNTRSGNTVYSWAPGQQLLETIWDGGGIDTINWSNQSEAANINLNAGQWSQLGSAYWDGVEYAQETLAIANNVTIENANGGTGNDTIIGNYASNVLTGGNGGDVLNGFDGNDTLSGGNGSDSLDGGIGFDTAEYTNAATKVTVNLNTGTASGGAGNDVLSNIEAVVGSSFNDTLIGNASNNSLDGGTGFDTTEYTNVATGVTVNLKTGTASGGAGNDVLFNIEAVVGSSFNDTLIGNADNNTLTANNGNDLLVGNVGNDSLTGGAGSDTFRFVSSNDGVDIITDFSSTADTIQVIATGFGGGLKTGRITASQFFLGSTAQDRSDRFIYNQSIGALYFDRDGIGSTAQIQLATLSNKPLITTSDIFVV